MHKKNRRNNQHVFRPTVGETRLEDRMVLNAAGSTAAVHVTTLVTGVTRVGQSTTGLGNLSLQQIRLGLRQQMAATYGALQRYVNEQVAALYANRANLAGGQLTPQARADFAANVKGAVDAAALRLSAQASLLPGAGARLVPLLQSSLLGSAPASLSSQLGNSASLARSRAQLQSTLGIQLNRSFRANFGRLGNYFVTTPLNRLSVSTATGQRIPLAQFMANQAAAQINNAFGALGSGAINNARTSLFDSAGNLNRQAVSAYQQAYNNALRTAAFQVGSVLSVFPNAAAALGPRLQSSFFGTGTDPLTGLPAVSFSNNLPAFVPSGATSAPLTFNSFNNGFVNGFSGAYQNFATPLNTFFGLTPTTGNSSAFQLSNGFYQTGAAFPSLFGNLYNSGTFNNGFNNGFAMSGSGFPGFGTAPTTFNSSFGTGFNGLTGNLNSLFGFSAPAVPTGLTPGTGSASSTAMGQGLTGGLGLSTAPVVPTGVTPGTGSGVAAGTGAGMLGSLGSIPVTGTAAGGSTMVSGLGSPPIAGTGSLDTGVIGGLGAIPGAAATVGAGTTGGLGTTTGGGFSTTAVGGTSSGLGTLTGSGYSTLGVVPTGGLGTFTSGGSNLGTGTATGLGAIPAGGNATLGTTTATGTTFGTAS